MDTSTAPTTRPAATSADEDAIIRAGGLERRYVTGKSSFLAVDGIDLRIDRGELYGLLGTNGAGKTSTLEVLEGLARPSGGSVQVFGNDPVRDRPRIRPRQGMMLQTGGFPADLTAREALAMWCSTLSAPRPVPELLEEVDLADRAAIRISSLSGGEVRRLDLACAIAGDPDLLFLDEPTTGLDPESRIRAWELIARRKEAGTTIVLTTHYLQEAESLADRLGIMHRGRIVREGTPAEIVTGHPATIRFDLPASTPDPAEAGPDPADLLGTLTIRRGHVEISTDHLQRDLAVLLRWAAGNDLTLDGLEARAASLETVFLDIADEGGPR